MPQIQVMPMSNNTFLKPQMEILGYENVVIVCFIGFIDSLFWCK